MMQDAFNNHIEAAGTQCQLAFEGIADSPAANLSQLCSSDESDPSAIKAILYSETAGSYRVSIALQKRGQKIVGLEGILYLSLQGLQQHVSLLSMTK